MERLKAQHQKEVYNQPKIPVMSNDQAQVEVPKDIQDFISRKVPERKKKDDSIVNLDKLKKHSLQIQENPQPNEVTESTLATTTSPHSSSLLNSGVCSTTKQTGSPIFAND